MRSDDVAEWPAPLAGRPEGACLQASPSAGLWWVRGRTATYTCNANENVCSCLDWLHRRAESRTACRHLRHLERYLSLHPCPCCQEEGCAACAGLGRVSDDERAALLEVIMPLPSDEELRTVFA